MLVVEAALLVIVPARQPVVPFEPDVRAIEVEGPVQVLDAPVDYAAVVGVAAGRGAAQLHRGTGADAVDLVTARRLTVARTSVPCSTLGSTPFSPPPPAARVIDPEPVLLKVPPNPQSKVKPARSSRRRSWDSCRRSSPSSRW